MQRVSVKLPKNMVDELDERADKQGVTRSDVIRDTLDDGLNTSNDEEIQQLQHELERCEQRVDRLQQANLLILEDRERTTELEVYVDEQRRRKEVGKLKAWWNDLTGWD